MISRPDLVKTIQEKNTLKTLQTLKTPTTSSQLSQRFNLEESSITKFLQSLERENIILKQGDTFVLSKLGTLLLEKSKGMEFLFRNSDYILNHSLEEIPQFLLQKTEAFSNCEVVEAIWPVFKKMEDFTKEAKTFVGCIFSEPPFLLADHLYASVQSGIKLRLLFGKNSILSDCNDLVDRFQLNKPKSDSLFEKRLCEKVITNLVVSDIGACLMLGDKKSKLDMAVAITGNDKGFVRWCMDLFEYKWKQGQPFARLRTNR